MSTPEDNVRVVHRWFEEVWNKGRADAIDELFAADGVAYGVGEAGRDVRGPGEFRAFFEHFRSAFPNPHFTVEDTVAAGDKVASRWTIQLHHSGEGFGVPPTGRQISASGMSIVRIRDGQIVDAWNVWDLLAVANSIAPEPIRMKFIP